MSLHEPRQILVITSYPPRVCGIATYAQDLLAALHRTYGRSMEFKVCALTHGPSVQEWPKEVACTLDTLDGPAYMALARRINTDPRIRQVWVQHEFGLYPGADGRWLIELLRAVKKPVCITFHTVLPEPTRHQEETIKALAELAVDIIVLTQRTGKLLHGRYGVPKGKINVLPHGAHPVPVGNTGRMKRHFGLAGKKVLSTFGLLGPNKSIETAIDALPAIVERVPEVIYLVLGRTHPEVVRQEGEAYRRSLEQRVAALGMEDHVRFVDQYLELHELLDYLRATDVYLFTSKDPGQAVSGTFTYALGCGCPVISTRIPHAEEMIDGAGVLVDFNAPGQMAEAAIALLEDDGLRHGMSLIALQRMQAWSWDNMAIAHMQVFTRGLTGPRVPRLHHPPVDMGHLRRMTTSMGMLQFARISVPDLASGHTVDDNARALAVVCARIAQAGATDLLGLAETYLAFLEQAIRPDGSFLNYFDTTGAATAQNTGENLDDANGRAIWALGETTATTALPRSMRDRAARLILRTMPHLREIRSPRSAAFIIKGLHAFRSTCDDEGPLAEINLLGNRLLNGADAHFSGRWKWIEPTVTYGSAVIPEALLLAWVNTGKSAYREAASATMHFLLGHLFKDGHFRGISNNGWLQPDTEAHPFGEQPIEAAYAVLALDRFHKLLQDDFYRERRDTAFAWFLGDNQLHQVVYDRSTGGCHDGLEEHNVNLNEGAESTVCYLLARSAVEPRPLTADTEPRRTAGSRKVLTTARPSGAFWPASPSF
jgi:glycosyltransferase involved in cell wall biosynthesis